MTAHQYVFNALDSLKSCEKILKKYGFEIMEVEQSPRSVSTYIVLEFKDKGWFKLRISNHFLPPWCETPYGVISETITNNGKFDLSFVEVINWSRMMAEGLESLYED